MCQMVSIGVRAAPQIGEICADVTFSYIPYFIFILQRSYNYLE
jgi:hypothetical protein